MPYFAQISVDLDSFIDELIQQIKENNKTIKKLLKVEKKTYGSFVKEMMKLEDTMEQLFTPLSHLDSVKNSKKSQKVYAEAILLITEYSTKLSQNHDIYKAYKEILQNEKNLTVAQKRVLELNILGFELSGAHLDKKSKMRLQKMELEMSRLTNEFSQNILNATNSYKLIIEDEKAVAALPQSDIAAASFIEDGITKYKFTLQMPSYLAYMTYGEDEKFREELYKAYTSRAPQNADIITKLLSLRDEMSHLLGFSDFSSYSLASKMAPNTETVLAFLNSLLQDSTKQAKLELDELKEFSKKELQSFDSAFYTDKLKKAKYSVDEEVYRAYFEQSGVVNGTFTFLGKLFGLEFKKCKERLWDKKATSYEVYLNHELKAKLYLDLEARKNKQGGAWMNHFQTRCADAHGNKQLASAVIVCNFSPAGKEYPSLLRHDDVVTFFHEMGHALHHMLSEVDEYDASGVNGVEWDAVEFPSQFLENFAYEKEVLKLFAKHYKTGEILSDEMINNLIRSKNFLSAMGMLRQLEFSLFDIMLHQKPHSKEQTQELLDGIRERTSLIKPPAYNKFQNGFSHIFSGGYAAGYYSYKWAEVLSADLFFRVVDEGIFGSQMAQKYLNIVLQGGGSQSMQKLFFEMTNEEPNPKSLLRLNGISA